MSWDRLAAGTFVVRPACPLGLFDDVAGVASPAGSGGHVARCATAGPRAGCRFGRRSLVGILTVLALQQDNGTVVGLLRRRATVALAANLGNLF